MEDNKKDKVPDAAETVKLPKAPPLGELALRSND